MPERLHEGDDVSWSWAGNRACGKVKSIFDHKVTRTIAGNEVVRHGSADNPAVYVGQDDGGRVLKLASELDKSGES
jgi:hypothetical protein